MKKIVNNKKGFVSRNSDIERPFLVQNYEKMGFIYQNDVIILNIFFNKMPYI